MNETYSASNPSEHLAYDPLLLHLGSEKNTKDNQYDDNNKKDKSNIVIKESKDDNKSKKQQSKSKETGQEETQLPPHWEQRKTPEGHIYYANHQTKTTQWHHPNLNNIYSPSSTSSTATNDSISAPNVDDSSKRKTKSTSKQTTDNNNNNNDNKISSSSSNVNKEKKKSAERKKSRSNSVSEMDAFVRVLRSPPKRVKVGYSTILFASHPSLSLQVLPVAQAACDWLNSQRKMNFRIENLAMNLNRSLIKGLHLWMTVYKDNTTKHSYDRTRKWCCKIFGLSSISMTLDPHLHGNSKSSKIMTDFLTWRTSLPSNVNVIYTLSHSRTYSCVVALYLSQNAREEPTHYDQNRTEEDLSFQRHHRHHRHHKDKEGEHKEKEGEHKGGEHKSEHNEIPESKDDKPAQSSSNVNNESGSSNIIHKDSGDKDKGIGSEDKKEKVSESEHKDKEHKKEEGDWKSEEERNRELVNPSSSSAPSSQHIDSGAKSGDNVKGDHKDGGSMGGSYSQSKPKPTEKKEKEEFNIENLTVF